MADIQRVVEILFNATDNTSGALKGIESNFKNLESAFAPFDQAQTQLIDLEKRVLAVGVALGGLAIFEAGKFNESIAEIGTLFNASADQVDNLKGEVLDFVSTSSSSIGDATDALYNYVSATGDTENSVKALSEIERLAIAGKADLNTATAAVSTVLNAYGLKMGDITDVSDIFFTTVQNGTTTLPELGQNIGRVAANAAAAGVDFDIIGASLAALTGSIGSTNLATTGLTALLRELANPTDELRAVLGPLADEAGKLPEKLELIQSATGGVLPEMNKLFGSTEASGAALILATDASGKFANSLESMETRAGATAAAYAEMEKQFGAVNNRLVNSVRTVLIAAGDNLIGGYSEIASSLASIFTALRPEINGGAFDPIFDFLDGKADEITSLFTGIGKALPEALESVDLDRLAKSFDTLFDSVEGLFSALFDDVDLTTADGLSDAIQTLLDGFALLNETVAGIANQWEPLFRVLGDAIQGNKDLDSSVGETVGSLVALGSQLGSISGIAGGAAGGLSVIADAVILMSGAKGLGALLPKLAALGPALGTVGVAVTTFVAAKGAAEFVGLDDLGSNLGSWLYDVVNGTDELAGSTERVTAGTKDLATAQSNLSGTSKELAESTENTAKARDYLAEVEKASAESKKADIALAEKQMAASKAYEDTLGGLTLEYDLATGKIIGFNDAGRQAYLNTKELGKEIRGADGSLLGYEKAADKAKDTTQQLAEKQEKADKQAEKLRITMLELASDERIKALEFAVDFKIAKVQADAQIVTAAFESIGATVESTGELLGTLYGELNNASRFDKYDIKSQIDREIKLREQAADQQQRLVETQIRNMELRNRQLAEGSALLEIDGTGLQPHLEAFMFEIVEALQVRISQDGLDLLLGAGP